MSEIGSVGITVITGDHVSAETWYDVPSEVLAELRERFGEPTVRQLVPVALAERMIDDPDHVALEGCEDGV